MSSYASKVRWTDTQTVATFVANTRRFLSLDDPSNPEGVVGQYLELEATSGAGNRQMDHMMMLMSGTVSTASQGKF